MKSVAVLGFAAAAIAFAAPASAHTNAAPAIQGAVDSTAGSTMPDAAPQNYSRHRFTSHRIVIRRAWIRTHFRYRLYTRLARPAVIRVHYRLVRLYPRVRYTVVRPYHAVRFVQVRAPRIVVRPQIRRVVYYSPRAHWRYNPILNRRSG